MTEYCIECGRKNRRSHHIYCDRCYKSKNYTKSEHNNSSIVSILIIFGIIAIAVVLFINNNGGITLNDCPQLSYLNDINIRKQTLNIEWNDITEIHQQVYSQSFFEWSIKSYQLKGDITCREGTKSGENLNHIYCGSLDLPTTYMIYNNIDDNGNILDIKKLTFVNEYDKKGTFIKTICGKTSEEIVNEKIIEKKVEEEKAYNDLKGMIGDIRGLFY